MTIPDGRSTLGNDGSHNEIYADVYETEDGTVVVNASLPHVERGSIRLSYAEGALTIRATVRDDDGLADDCRGPQHGSATTVARTVKLPADIDPRMVRGTFERGVLNIRAPKVGARCVEVARVG